jgi:hypothetical protein
LRLKRLGTAAAALVVATATVLTSAAALGPGHRTTAKSGLTIRGHVRGLYPGAHKKVRLVVRNRSRRALQVRSIRTRVRNAGPLCSGKYVRVDRFKGRVRLGPGRWRRVFVRIRMLETAPDACQRAKFPLEFRGTATPLHTG